MSNDKRARSVFSERLRMLRKSNNLTQKQVAQSLSIDQVPHMLTMKLIKPSGL